MVPSRHVAEVSQKPHSGCSVQDTQVSNEEHVCPEEGERLKRKKNKTENKM